MTTEELVLVALPPADARALGKAATIGRGMLPPRDYSAAGNGLELLERALDGDPDDDVETVRAGIAALDALMSHDADLIVIDPSDGTGLVEPDDYRALYDLLALLRNDPRVEETVAAEATASYRGVTASIRIEDDPEPEFAETHLRVRAFCDPPPRGYDRELATWPVLLKDIER